MLKYDKYYQFENFKEFYIKLVQRKEVKQIFDTIANTDKTERSETTKNVIRVKEFLGQYLILVGLTK